MPRSEGKGELGTRSEHCKLHRLFTAFCEVLGLLEDFLREITCLDSLQENSTLNLNDFGHIVAIVS